MARRQPRGEESQEELDDQRTAFGAPVAASSYSLSGAIADVGLALVAHEADLSHLREVEVAYLRRDSSRTDNEFHVDKASGVWKRSERELALRGDVQVGVWLQGRAWDGFGLEQRRAWLHSLLLRIVLTEKGMIKLIRPDVVEWPSIIGRYGAWNEQLKLALESRDRHEVAAPRTLRSVPAEQAGGARAN